MTLYVCEIKLQGADWRPMWQHGPMLLRVNADNAVSALRSEARRLKLRTRFRVSTYVREET